MPDLIPSDLGAHNALRGTDGRLCFLDFEYFGWTTRSPASRTSSCIPACGSPSRRRRVIRNLFCAISAETSKPIVCRPLMPLYALRWCAIILGELLPERWQQQDAEQSGHGQLG